MNLENLLFSKIGLLILLFIVLLLLPMSWPVIILIMIISVFASFNNVILNIFDKFKKK